MAWREWRQKQRDKTDHRLAFLVSAISGIGRMIVQASGAKITGASPSMESFYIDWGGENGQKREMSQEGAKALFETIKSMAKDTGKNVK